jgi:hypothetical protein
MRRLPITISLFTDLFFVFSLAGNAVITDPTFPNVAFTDDDDKDKKKKRPRSLLYGFNCR